MNRAQRRKAMKNKQYVPRKEPVYNLKSSDISNMKKTATSDAIDTAMALLLSIPIKVMHDKYGWGMKKRLPEFADALIDEYQEFADGNMSLEEYQEMVYEYCGVKFIKNPED